MVKIFRLFFVLSILLCHLAYGVQVDSSLLPIISINTKGGTIKDNAKINVKFNLIFNNSGKYNYLKDSSKYLQYAGIEIRGSSSQFMYPKKSYGLETRDAKGIKLDTSLLGMPSENDWVLLANYSDKTLMRNSLSYQIFNQMGHYASRTRFVELVINGTYQGVYVLGEKIKRDKNRVSISKITAADTAGDALTGGYIVKVDKNTGSFVYSWQSKYKPADSSTTATITVMIHDPDTLKIQQQNYIKKYFQDSFERTLKSAYFKDTIKGWRRYAHEKSFIDYLILNELANNVDAYRYSTFLYKDKYSKKQGKIHIGPAWDYDITWHNANFFNGASFTNWCYKPTANGTALPFWWMQLMKDPLFTQRLNCRWKENRRTFLSDATLMKEIDSMSTTLNDAQGRNFKTWKILGTYVWPNPVYPGTYKGEVDTMKNWIKNRTKFLDKNMPGTCPIDYVNPTVKLIGKDTVLLGVFNHYVDAGIDAFDDVDSYNVAIKVVTNLDSSKLGKYYVTFTVTDKALNSVSITRYIKVIDTTAPKLTFKNGNSLKHQVPYLFNDSDIIIKDNYDPTTSINVKRVDNFTLRNASTIKVGNYVSNYFLKDLSGNKSFFIKHFEVIDTIAPVIKLAGNPIVKLMQHDAYTDSGYTVSDNYYSNASLKITTFSTLKSTDSVGDFVINYQAKDSSNNSAKTGDRKIHIDKSTGINESVNQNSGVKIYPNPISNNYFYLQSDLKEIKVSIYDLLGKEICTFIGSSNGKYELPASTSNGLYLVEINANGFTTKQKIMVLRGL